MTRCRRCSGPARSSSTCSRSRPADGAYVRGRAELRRRFRGERFDVVHAHFGLTAWPAHAVRRAHGWSRCTGPTSPIPRSRAITLAALRSLGPRRRPSSALASGPAWACSPSCPGPALRRRSGRFGRIDRARRAPARARPRRPLPAVPRRSARPEKRFDRAQALIDGTTRRAADARRRRPRRRPAVGQRRQRRAGPVRARGVRARRARGAGVRCAGAGDSGRGRARRAGRASPARCARRSTSPSGAPRCRRTCAPMTRACPTAAPTPSRIRATRARAGVRCLDRAARPPRLVARLRRGRTPACGRANFVGRVRRGRTPSAKFAASSGSPPACGRANFVDHLPPRGTSSTKFRSGRAATWPAPGIRPPRCGEVAGPAIARRGSGRAPADSAAAAPASAWPPAPAPRARSASSARWPGARRAGERAGGRRQRLHRHPQRPRQPVERRSRPRAPRRPAPPAPRRRRAAARPSPRTRPR